MVASLLLWGMQDTLPLREAGQLTAALSATTPGQIKHRFKQPRSFTLPLIGVKSPDSAAFGPADINAAKCTLQALAQTLEWEQCR